MVFFRETTYLEKKMECMTSISMTNRVKEHVGFHNIFRIQDDDCAMCEFYCIAFIQYMISGKLLLDYTNLFFPNDYKENDKIIYISTLKTNMTSLDFRLKNIDETRNYLLEEIKHNDLMSEKHRKVCRALKYFEYFLVFVSAVSDCVSISTFVSLVGVFVGVLSSATGLKMCAITAEIKKYKSIINKKRKRHNKIEVLGKAKLDIIEYLKL